MGRRKKRPDLFAGHVSGSRHVLLAAVMPLAVAMIDGITIGHFGGKNPAWYLNLDDAINWLNREIAQVAQPQNTRREKQYLDDLRIKLEILTAYKAAPDDLLDAGPVQYDKEVGAFVAAQGDRDE
jgi:hypothetical protein